MNKILALCLSGYCFSIIPEQPADGSAVYRATKPNKKKDVLKQIALCAGCVGAGIGLGMYFNRSKEQLSAGPTINEKESESAEIVRVPTEIKIQEMRLNTDQTDVSTQADNISIIGSPPVTPNRTPSNRHAFKTHSSNAADISPPSFNIPTSDLWRRKSTNPLEDSKRVTTERILPEPTLQPAVKEPTPAQVKKTTTKDAKTLKDLHHIESIGLFGNSKTVEWKMTRYGLIPVSVTTNVISIPFIRQLYEALKQIDFKQKNIIQYNFSGTLGTKQDSSYILEAVANVMSETFTHKHSFKIMSYASKLPSAEHITMPLLCTIDKDTINDISSWMSQINGPVTVLMHAETISEISVPNINIISLDNKYDQVKSYHESGKINNMIAKYKVEADKIRLDSDTY